MRIIAVIFLLFATPLFAAESRIQRGLSYAEPKNQRQMLDVYCPSKGDKNPIIVWIHGGGWRAGDKAGVQRKPAAFTKEEFVFVSVNYRLVPQVTLKEMTGDIAKAIKWIHDHAKDFGGDPNTIFVAGHSAGAHLAALVCTDGRYLQAEGLTLANITGCVPVDTAAYDVPKRVADAGKVPEKATEVFGKDEDSQKELSPITYVAKGKNIPPFCLLHVADRVESTAQTKDFAKALEDAEIEATVVPGEGKTHGTINSDLGIKGDKPTEAVFKFLGKALKKKQ
jgi:arylformamidase